MLPKAAGGSGCLGQSTAPDWRTAGSALLQQPEVNITREAAELTRAEGETVIDDNHTYNFAQNSAVSPQTSHMTGEH